MKPKVLRYNQKETKHKRKGEKKMTIREMIKVLEEMEKEVGDAKITIENEEEFEMFVDTRDEVSIYVK